ncbi:RluA family pseudouridine synthase [Aquabacterium sp. J223]|uniref:RluA family pseudouridine synthase n=1 Tax=Aquabacterium sp. J223 TaxID=2898431 RepID=UPI0021ADDBF9|nr:RluA family pseudouridine synthase [Aquabacterium sp. J223]UUX97015.1 RluA family pseudouridine synthase [Aquabacterium sp. J223]
MDPALLPDEEAADPAAEPEVRRLQVGVDGHGERLDKVLVGMAPEFSRSHLQGLIDGGHVRVDGAPAASASRRLKAGQAVEATLVPTAESRAFRAQPLALDIVFEDEHLLVLDKPAGLVVHPAAGHWSGTLLNGLLHHHPGAAALPRAGIVHRLDKDTSGLMVVGKTLPAVTALVRAIAAREVHRSYLALAHGVVAPASFSVEAPIARDPVSRLRMAIVAGGKPARTDVERLAARSPSEALPGGVSALRCTLHSGRTHQIRVHLASRGHPLLADALYGGRPTLGLTRQALHAQRLVLRHPARDERLSFERALPPDLAAAWATVAEAPRG